MIHFYFYYKVKDLVFTKVLPKIYDGVGDGVQSAIKKRIESISYLEIAILSVVTGKTIYDILNEKFMNRRLNNKNVDKIDEETIQEGIEVYKLFIEATSKGEKQSMDEFFKSYKQKYLRYSKLVGESSTFRKRLQNDEFICSLLDTINDIDEKLKACSLEEMPDIVPIYPMSDQLAQYGTENIKIIHSIRALLILTIDKVFQQYEKVSSNVVHKIILIATNPKASAGLRRYVNLLLNYLSQYEENCMTIAVSNGIPLLKYYDFMQIPERHIELETLDRILHTLRSKRLPREIQDKLSTKQYKLLQLEIASANNSAFKSSLYSVFLGFTYSYYKTKSILLASTSFLLSSSEKILSSGRTKFLLTIYGVSAIIPHGTPMIFTPFVVALVNAYIPLIIGKKGQRNIDDKEYTAAEYDQMIPSILQKQ